MVNGVKIVDKQFLGHKGTVCPETLVGMLTLQKGFVAKGYWIQVKAKVTNVNIFSGLMPEEKMKDRTAGEDCEKADGDYLSWTNSSWTLQGSAKWSEVSVEELCRKDSSISLFMSDRVERPTLCEQLCPKLHLQGRMASAETPVLFDKLRSRLRKIAEISPNLIHVWLPISKAGDRWIDSFTGNDLVKPQWGTKIPVPDPKRICAVYLTLADGFANWPCKQTGGSGGWYCSCSFPQQPYLTLRGLCKDSNIDQTYLPKNNPVDGGITYYGNIKAQASYLSKSNKWKMDTALFNTTALSVAISKRFMLGKQNWTIENDSMKCYEGLPYTIELKLTGCREGQFTCNDGQCIAMEERCDQMPDCLDKSDEVECHLLVLENGYNKNIPPIASTIPRVDVNVAITLMKVVEIAERDHSILFQFQISLRWKESERVTYRNLKHDVSLNALTDADVGKLWLPLIIYDNTDQKQRTRLGALWEWDTTVTVTREGNLTRSGIDEVDEIEKFKGAENTLTMNQTYTQAFQCQYKLNRYPFDTQVRLSTIKRNSSFHFQECKIKMTTSSLAKATVELVQGLVGCFKLYLRLH